MTLAFTERLSRPRSGVVNGGLDADLPGFSSYRPSAPLAGVVEEIWEWDVPQKAVATRSVFRLAPSLAPTLMLQYREPHESDHYFGSAGYHHRPWRNIVTTLQSGICVSRPTGAVGTLFVRLRPESAAKLFKVPAVQFLDRGVDLESVFKAGRIATLEDAVSMADDSEIRIRILEAFLLEHLSWPFPEQHLPGVAAERLRRNPSLQVSQIASDLGVSARHLSREFNGAFGTSPKRFARSMRVEKALLSRPSGKSWLNIALECGFHDQAHLIRDVKAVTGLPPQTFFQVMSGMQAAERQK